MSLKFWNKEISFINSAKNAVYSASDYEYFKVEDLKVVLSGLNNLLKTAEENNISNVYENEDYLNEKKLVVLNVKSLIESAEKCKNSEIHEEFGDIFKIGAMSDIITKGEVFTQVK